MVCTLEMSRTVMHNYRCVTEWDEWFYKNKSLKIYFEELNEEGLVIISRFFHYSLFIIVCSASPLPKIIVFTAHFCKVFFFAQSILLTKCILLNHPQCMGIQNNILGCKGACDISSFCWIISEWLCSVPYRDCYFCYSPVYLWRICSWWVAVLSNMKVRTSAITFCNSQTLIQNCPIYVMFYEGGLQQGIMLDIGLSV